MLLRSRSNYRSWILFALLGALSWCRGEQYEAQGSLTYSLVNTNTGLPAAERQCDFSVSVNDCKWFIRTVPTKFTRLGQARPLEDSIVAASDATNMFYLASYERIAAERQEKSESRTRNVASGHIGNGIVPHGSDPTLPVLWYGLGSACYMATKVTNGWLHSVSSFKNAAYYSKDWRVSATWELLPLPPHLPKAIVFSGSYKFLQEAPTPVFDEPLNPTNCIYSVLDLITKGHLTLPRRATASFPNTNGLQTVCTFEVTNVLDRCSVIDFTPRLPGLTVLSDLRPISHLLSKGVGMQPTTNWPVFAVSKEMHDRILRSKIATNAQGPRRDLWILAILLVPLLSPLVFLLHKTKNKKQKKTL
jgi:hypothetical protein